MKTISKEELQRRIKLHELWLKNRVHIKGEKLVLIDYDLSDSDLRGSDLSDSDLRGSDLSYSDLSDSDLRGSDLSYSDLSYSDLSGSNLRGSNLSGSDLRNCIGNMKEVKSLHFDNWIVTYTDTILNIGCKSYPIEDWFKFSDDKIHGMDLGSLSWWRKYRDILKQIIEASNNAAY